MTSEIFHDFFTYTINKKESGLAFVIWVKFQKDYNCEGCAVGKEFRMAGE